MKKRFSLYLLTLSLVVSVLTGCSNTETGLIAYQAADTTIETFASSATENSAQTATSPKVSDKSNVFSLDSIPEYNGKPYIAVNNNKPFFNDSDLTAVSYEQYSDLDSLGRCGTATASVGTDIIPTEQRDAIGQIKPTGWHTVKYDNVDGKYLYNRCHLIGYQLTGENANEKNLITGTRYMNVTGMLPFENMVTDYVKETNNHVLYRVTPIFDGNNLLAHGVLMEAVSIEDNGAGICYNVFCYNAQPGIQLNYANGDSSAEDTIHPSNSSGNTQAADYIGNKNTKKLHYPNCRSVSQINDSNKDYLHCTRDEALSKGYVPCKNCNP